MGSKVGGVKYFLWEICRINDSHLVSVTILSIHLQSKELGFSRFVGSVMACSIKTVKDQLGIKS